MTTDTHDRMIAAFQEYFKWQIRFEHHESDEAGIKARIWLSEIRKEAKTRRDEIQAKRKVRDKTRIRKVGRPRKIIKDR